MKRMMDRLKYLMVVLAAIVLPAWAWASSEGITLLGASQIGDNAAKAIHYDVEHFERTITLFESPENGILPKGAASEPVQRLRHRLENHTYWAVHYQPKDRKNHGDELAIFIDSTTGAILGIYTGE